jgi:hypothetical protein
LLHEPLENLFFAFRKRREFHRGFFPGADKAADGREDRIAEAEAALIELIVQQGVSHRRRAYWRAIGGNKGQAA